MKIVGLCGGSSSGKSTLSCGLKQYFKDNLNIITMDNYYIEHVEISYEERKFINYDVPQSIDSDQIISYIKMLKNGKNIVQPYFSFKTLLNDHSKSVITKPADILIVDGIFSLYYPELNSMMDLKVFIDNTIRY